MQIIVPDVEYTVNIQLFGILAYYFYWVVKPTCNDALLSCKLCAINNHQLKSDNAVIKNGLL